MFYRNGGGDLCYARWDIFKDRGPSINDKDHLVGLLTLMIPDFQMSQSQASFWVPKTRFLAAVFLNVCV